MLCSLSPSWNGCSLSTHVNRICSYSPLGPGWCPGGSFSIRTRIYGVIIAADPKLNCWIYVDGCCVENIRCYSWSRLQRLALSVVKLTEQTRCVSRMWRMDDCWKKAAWGQQRLRTMICDMCRCGSTSERERGGANTPVPQSWWPLKATSIDGLSMQLVDYENCWKVS